ncbi:hypothetical protein CS542_07725 [Pedobacter sp. IW39]|nr:hypothetical protein CS542_07725 [Pedobacter sp. IW39]
MFYQWCSNQFSFSSNQSHRVLSNWNSSRRRRTLKFEMRLARGKLKNLTGSGARYYSNQVIGLFRLDMHLMKGNPFLLEMVE